jgi:DNA polymerase III epsilon subunit family exonuclease
MSIIRDPSTFYSLDVETSGLNANKDEILEFAIIFHEKGVEKEILHSFINPGEIEFDPAAMAVNNITKEDLVGAPTLEEFLPDLFDFLKKHQSIDAEDLFDMIFVAHNHDFDYGFIKTSLEKRQFEWAPRQIICTMRAAKDKFGGHSNLKAVSEKLGISYPTGTHRADVDARLGGQVYLKLIEEKVSTQDHNTLFANSVAPDQSDKDMVSPTVSAPIALLAYDHGAIIQHRAFVEKFGKPSLWYLPAPGGE